MYFNAAVNNEHCLERNMSTEALMMKKLLVFCISVLNLMLFAYESPFQGDSRPPRRIQVSEEKLLEIHPGEQNAEIVVCANASKMTRFAAMELQSLLEIKLSEKLPVVNTPDDSKISFILGINAFSDAVGIDASGLVRDAFIIKTVGQDVYILGRDDPDFDEFAAIRRISGWQFQHEKGTVFGVYDFLERIADARFFFAGPGTLIPKGTLRIPSIDVYDRPDYEARQVQIYEGKHFLPENGILERNLDYLRMRFETQYVPCCHGIGNLGYWERFGKTHPEYFFLDSSGRRVTEKRSDVWMEHYCYTSGVKEELYQDAKSCLLNEPASKRGIRSSNGQIGWDPTAQQPGRAFCAMPGDSFMRCHCENCQSLMTDEQMISDFYWGFVFDLAERLIREKVPGIVTNMSYAPYHLVPRNRKMPPNVYVMVAGTGAWNERYPEHQQRETERIRQWVDFGGRKVWLWNYPNKFADRAFPGIPHTTPRCIGRYYQSMAPLIYGAFIESETDYYAFNLLQYYVFSRVSWNNQVDVNALLTDYYQRMFGKGAPVMQEFFDRIEFLWLHKLLKDPMMTDLGPSNVTASNHEAWTEVYGKAQREEFKRMFDLAESLAASSEEDLKRVRLFREIFLDVILRYGEEYDRQVDTIPRFFADAVSLAEGQSISIDGRLDEAAWKHTGMHLQNITGGNSDKSQVWVTHDATNLYLAFNFSEPKMGSVRAPKRSATDTDLWKDNGIEFFLNPDCSRNSYYHIILSSSGNWLTKRYVKHGISRIASEWSPDLDVTVVCSEDSLRGELAIPLADLEVQAMEVIVLNINRHQVRESEADQYYSWSPFLNRQLTSMFHDPDNFGTVFFNRNIPENLVKDSDFSAPKGKAPNAFGAWHHHHILPENTSISYDSNTFISGSRSIRLHSAGASLALRQDLPLLKPNTKYKISFFVRLEQVEKKGRFSGVCLNIMDDKNLWFPSTFLLGTIPWVYQETEFTSAPNTNDPAHRSYLLLYLMGASGTAWFDQIKLQEIPSVN